MRIDIDDEKWKHVLTAAENARRLRGDRSITDMTRLLYVEEEERQLRKRAKREGKTVPE